LGIDVGTRSARAGIFDAVGRMAGMGSAPIQLWHPVPDHVEQSSDDIWRACGRAVRAALHQAGLRAAAIAGIGFDATCSLVVLDSDDRPVSISLTRKSTRNVIAWMDHRAISQAERIDRVRHDLLRYVGGGISPEMQTPKLLWLKQHLPSSWQRAARFLDLPDFLTYKATGDDTRSLCTTVCKWTYLGQNGLDGAGWDGAFFRQIGLGDLAREKFARIGRRVRPMGEPLANGLTCEAARNLGLHAGTPVGVSMIDAHAGGLGLLGAPDPTFADGPSRIKRRLALVGGTSSCHLAVSGQPRFIAGVWGPYYSAMIPDLWLHEAGQSASGALVDHVINTHAAIANLQTEAKRKKRTVYELLNTRLDALAISERVPHPGALTRELHVQPDFHGNRSPHADPTLKGAISGLTLSATADDLARLYLATVQSIAHGTRHIVETLNRSGYAIDTLLVCGGGSKNPVFLREHADITGCRLILPKEPEAVLLGSAVLGAVAGQRYGTIPEAMRTMNAAGRVISPQAGEVAKYHAAKHRIFRRMHDEFLAHRRIMSEA
jgi:FGGY-family pentulose kinase